MIATLFHSQRHGSFIALTLNNNSSLAIHITTNIVVEAAVSEVYSHRSKGSGVGLARRSLDHTSTIITAPKRSHLNRSRFILLKRFVPSRLAKGFQLE